MKVMTLNTHSWLEENPQEKMEQIVTAILAGGYDIIALQEVNQSLFAEVIETNAYFCETEAQYKIKADNFAYLIVENLRAQGAVYYWSWVYNHIGYSKYDEGVALLSKTPLDSRNLLISSINDPQDYHTRRTLVAETTWDGESVTVASCHFSWWESAKSGFIEEWQRVETELQKTALPYLLMGDFNNPAGQEGYQRIMKSPLKLVDAYQMAKAREGEFTVEKNIDGWEESTEKLRIDYIFVSDSLEVETYTVIFNDKNQPIVSDHYGIAVHLTK